MTVYGRKIIHQESIDFLEIFEMKTARKPTENGPLEGLKGFLFSLLILSFFNFFFLSDGILNLKELLGGVVLSKHRKVGVCLSAAKYKRFQINNPNDLDLGES